MIRLLPRSRRGIWLLAGAIAAATLSVIFFLTMANRPDATAARFQLIRDTMTPTEISELLEVQFSFMIGELVNNGAYYQWDTADGTIGIEFGFPDIRKDRTIGTAIDIPEIRKKWYSPKSMQGSIRKWFRRTLNF